MSQISRSAILNWEKLENLEDVSRVTQSAGSYPEERPRQYNIGTNYMELLRFHYWHLGAMLGPMGYLIVSQAPTQKMLQLFQFLQLWQPKRCPGMPGWQALENDLKYCKTLEQNLNTKILTNEKVHKIKCKMVKSEHCILCRQCECILWAELKSASSSIWGSGQHKHFRWATLTCHRALHVYFCVGDCMKF